MTDRESRSQSKSYTRLRRVANTQLPFDDLANAIVCFAVDDYRRALTKRSRSAQRELEKFFRSDWYGALTTIDPEMLIQKLNEEYQLKRQMRKQKMKAES